MIRKARIPLTICIIIVALGLVAFGKAEYVTIEDIFDKVSKIERFETMPFNGGDFGFPDELGTGLFAIHPNASPREEIERLLKKLPRKSLVYDETDDNGRFDRFYIENETSLLYVHVGAGTGDTVVNLFKDCNRDKMAAFVESLRNQKRD